MLPITKIFDKNLSKEKDNLSNEYYLALVIDNQTVKSGIWRFANQEGELLSAGSLEDWEGEDADELIVATDASIASAVAKIPEISTSQPTKVLLGLPQSWLSKNNLESDKTKILQTICKKLLLSPLGFVITSEAVSHFLKKEEGDLPNAILVFVNETFLVISLISQGKYLGSEEVERSDNLPLDLKEGLQRFDYGGALPSRILLLRGSNLEEVRQRLIAYPWIGPGNEEKLSFLQLPRVDITEENFDLSAVIFGGSQELMEQKSPPAVKPEEGEQESTPVIQDEKEEIRGQVTEEKRLEEEILTDGSFGFVKGEDIAKTAISPTELEKVVPVTGVENRLVVPDNFEVVNVEATSRKTSGFFLKEIIKKIFQKKNISKPIARNEYLLENNSSRNGFNFQGRKKFNLFKFVGGIFFNRFTFFLLTILVMVSLILAFSFWKIVKAEVKLLVRPLTIEKEFVFTVSSQVKNADLEKMILPAIESTLDVSGDKTVEVKGKKVVGEKATGEVVVYNRTEQIKTLPVGTIIKGPNNLKFTLKEEVKIASKTADFDTKVDKWGEAKGKVEAVDIGPQYNLEVDANVSLENVSNTNLLVKNLSAFSGGTSREIQAVSKDDRQNLQKLLSGELLDKASREIEDKIASSEHLLESSVQVKAQTSHFDHEVGDEVPSLSLEEKATYSYLYFKNQDLDQLVSKVISSLLVEAYQREPFRNERSFSLADKDKNLYTAKILQSYYPLINTDEVAQKLQFKNISQAGNYLRNITSVSGYKILVTPSIFAKFNYFPLRSKNIKIVVEPGE